MTAASESKSQDDGTLLLLSARDRMKAMSMLANERLLGQKGVEPEWRLELQRMLMLGYKGEMEALDRRESGGITRWVEKRLLEKLGNSEETFPGFNTA